MAPPIPGLRRPPQRRRSAGDVLAGLLAVIALAALTVGVPLALISLFGLPVPHHLSASAFTRQLDLAAILKVLAVVIWLAWLQLVWCVVVEVQAAIRNAGMPSRVPLAGGTQSVVHRLVTAVLLLFTATAAITPALLHSGPAGPARPAVAITQQVQTASQHGGEHAHAPEAAVGRHHAEKIYVVQPPAGRYHESLWEIAQNHLGNGRRYGEIFELNKDRVQPDGSKLTIASLIRPGWVLHMPHDAHGPGIQTVSREDVRALQHGESMTRLQRAQAKETSLAGAAAGAQGHGGGLAGGSGHAGTGGQAAAQHAAHGYGYDYARDLAMASLLAAGLLAALGRRRREQLWRRAFGRRLAVPSGDAAIAEAAIRLGAGPQQARLLDTGLRHLCAVLAGQDRQPPQVFAARLNEEHLDLLLALPDREPPWPWTAADGGRTWRLPLGSVPGLDLESAGQAGAPFPGLVSLGTDDDGRVLVDLEAAHGLIAVTGPDDLVQATLAAMAMELATNQWSDQMEITLVGFGDELTTIAPDRVRAVDSLADVLPGLEARAAEAERAAAQAGGVLTGRIRDGHLGAWTPHYLIMARPPAGDEQDRLVALARSRDRTGAGYLVAGDVPGAAWTWQVTQDRRLQADLLGFDVAAQLLPREQYAAVVELFATASDTAGTPMRRPPADAAPAAQLVPGARMPVEVSLLGPVSVQAPGAIEPERAALAAEIVVYLAAHPGGVHLNVLTGAVWPRGVTADVRDASLGRVRDWLGYDEDGRPRLATDADGRLALGPEVRVDWQVFRALVGRAWAEEARGSTAEADYLERALHEIQGPLLDGRDQRRYAWLATDDLEYEVGALVADVAHRLSGLRRGSDPEAAMAAARAGLRLAAGDELLWRDLLLAAHASGDSAALQSVISEITTRTAADRVLAKLAPETEALIDELLPSWRLSVA
ncbi:MAG TPA: hypothetical protein VH637_17245 [Streptosporangiaceae bacterium]|jgi:hypothetical protein